MAADKSRSSVSRIKTGSFERRLSLTRAGLFAGTRVAGHYATNWFGSRERREARRSDMLSRQAGLLVEELGKLKGSVVKIGQVMALYGEHFLPPEVTEALHTLEDQTCSLEWPAIRRTLVEEMGEAQLAKLEVDEEPIGAASLGQVHRAVRLEDGLEMVLKVQYPGVADAVDTDLNSVAQMLKIMRVVSFGADFDEWLEEVRAMMHREVDYELEARTTESFRQKLLDDPRYVVPRVIKEFSSPHVIATTFESGYSVSSKEVQALSLARRSALGKASLELFLSELFIWNEIQTDPNFGNYRIRLAPDDQSHDKIVLLDFGAVQSYSDSFLDPVREMIRASYDQDLERVIEGGIALRFMEREWPQEVLKRFGEVCMAVLEPLARKEQLEMPPGALNENGDYRWKQSDLPNRIARQATRSAISRYFRVPPKEFIFLNRKLVGVYTFIAVLGAEFDGEPILRKYLLQGSE
ncbi:MAG: AarF/ABC1/UbiB kinase family protein [Halomonadaceae bacterium]|nr:MAG: AarF/ABC1/UbiB kinase family protein [Halomonadaceae bacterium]